MDRFERKERYSPNNLPLWAMMLTGGVAGSIAEVITPKIDRY